MQSLDIKKITVFTCTPTISVNDLIIGTQLDGIVRLDLSKIPLNYTIVGFYIWCDSLELENFTYGSVVLSETSHFRFARRNAGKGFKIVASVIRL